MGHETVRCDNNLPGRDDSSSFRDAESTRPDEYFRKCVSEHPVDYKHVFCFWGCESRGTKFESLVF